MTKCPMNALRCDGPESNRRRCVTCSQTRIDTLELKVGVLLPVALAAVRFWRSDQGDTAAENALFNAVEIMEKGHDISTWRVTEKRDGEKCCTCRTHGHGRLMGCKCKCHLPVMDSP